MWYSVIRSPVGITELNIWCMLYIGDIKFVSWRLPMGNNVLRCLSRPLVRRAHCLRRSVSNPSVRTNTSSVRMQAYRRRDLGNASHR